MYSDPNAAENSIKMYWGILLLGTDLYLTCSKSCHAAVHTNHAVREIKNTFFNIGLKMLSVLELSNSNKSEFQAYEEQWHRQMALSATILQSDMGIAETFALELQHINTSTKQRSCFSFLFSFFFF